MTAVEIFDEAGNAILAYLAKGTRSPSPFSIWIPTCNGIIISWFLSCPLSRPYSLRLCLSSLTTGAATFPFCVRSGSEFALFEILLSD